MNKYNLKGYQFKNIIEQYNTENPTKLIKSYKYKTISELNEIIKNNKIDITKYKIINHNQFINKMSIYLKKQVLKHIQTNFKMFLSKSLIKMRDIKILYKV